MKVFVFILSFSTSWSWALSQSMEVNSGLIPEDGRVEVTISTFEGDFLHVKLFNSAGDTVYVFQKSETVQKFQLKDTLRLLKIGIYVIQLRTNKGVLYEYLVHYGNWDVFLALQVYVEPEPTPRFHLYPNPGTGSEISLQLEGLTLEDTLAVVRVYDQQGRLWRHNTLEINREGLLRLSLYGYPAGLYLVSVQIGETRQTERLVYNPAGY